MFLRGRLLLGGRFLGGLFLGRFLGGALLGRFCFLLVDFLLLPPRAARSASIWQACSNVISSGTISLRSDALVVPSVTYGP